MPPVHPPTRTHSPSPPPPPFPPQVGALGPTLAGTFTIPALKQRQLKAVVGTGAVEASDLPTPLPFDGAAFTVTLPLTQLDRYVVSSVGHLVPALN